MGYACGFAIIVVAGCSLKLCHRLEDLPIYEKGLGCNTNSLYIKLSYTVVVQLNSTVRIQFTVNALRANKSICGFPFPMRKRSTDGKHVDGSTGCFLCSLIINHFTIKILTLCLPH